MLAYEVVAYKQISVTNKTKGFILSVDILVVYIKEVCIEEIIILVGINKDNIT